MKLTDEIQRILVKGLTSALTQAVSVDEFNKVYISLDTWHEKHNIIPYKVYTESKVLDKSTPSIQIFKAWLSSKTCNIDKDFNKGRKLVRLLKSTVDRYEKELPYTLSSVSIFTVMQNIFLVDFDDIDLWEDPRERVSFRKAFSYLRGYLASIYLLDLSGDNSINTQIIDIFINSERENLIPDLMNLRLG